MTYACDFVLHYQVYDAHDVFSLVRIKYIDVMVDLSPNESAARVTMKKKQRSLRKAKASFPEEDSGDDESGEDGVGLVIRPVSKQNGKEGSKVGQGLDPAAIIAARKQKKKDARKVALSSSGGAKPATIYSSSKDDYSAERMKEMAEMNVKVIGSFRRDAADVDRGMVSGGFRVKDDVVMVDAHVPGETTEGMQSDDIPDESYIKQAKEKRERLRVHGAMDVDAAYIPLGPSHVTTSQRMVESDVEQDDDLEEWMQDQLRKGISSGSVRGKDLAAMPREPKQYGGREHNEFSSLSSIDPSVLADRIFKDIQRQFESVDLTCQQHAQGMKKTEENLLGIEKKIKEDQALMGELDMEFATSQEMKIYTASLCSMLREKSPIIEEIQIQMVKSIAARYRARSERFLLHLDEIRQTAGKGVDAGMNILMTGGTEAEARLASDDAIQAAEEQLSLGTHIPESLDEFGRDLNSEKRYKIKHRISKMNRRFASIASSSNRHAVDDVLSAGESDDECERFTQRQQDIRLECRSLFVDTEDSFSSIEAIKERLESWKSQFAEQYDATFMGLSAPALFAPFVRLELVDWNPMDPSSVPFNQHHWYLSLFDFGINSAASDPDHDLIPNLVKSIVLPMVLDLFQDAWDPMDLAQSRSLSAIIEDIAVYFDNQIQFRDMFGFLSARLKESVNVLEPPHWHPSGMNTTLRAKVLWTILFKRSVDLVKCICCFKSVVSTSDLDTIAFELLGRSMMRLIRACMLESDQCMEMIVETLDAIPQDILTDDTGVYTHLTTFSQEISTVIKALVDAKPDMMSSAIFTHAVQLLPPVLRLQFDSSSTTL